MSAAPGPGGFAQPVALIHDVSLELDNARPVHLDSNQLDHHPSARQLAIVSRRSSGVNGLRRTASKKARASGDPLSACWSGVRVWIAPLLPVHLNSLRHDIISAIMMAWFGHRFS
jgi:hypothetical protein